ncbi:MAG: 23S rRNA (guanosine(2251)-2'-O)-methyltransferase RlmB [Brevinematia bacterium]
MIIYGKNSVFEAIKDKIKITKIFIDKDKKGKFITLLKEIENNGIKIAFLTEKEIEKISHTQKHQGICAEISLPPTIMEDEKDFEFDESVRNVLILDGITDTGNFGAIIRSALLLGCDLIILPKDNSARITPQTIKSSAGAVYKQRILYVNNLNLWLTRLKEENFQIFGFSVDAEMTIIKTERSDKLACIIGSEHSGLRKSTKKLCDRLIYIPTTEKLNSLNAGVASAIVMWELFFKDVLSRKSIEISE